MIQLYSAGITQHVVDRIFNDYVRHSGSLTINRMLSAKERTLRENLRLARKYVGIVRVTRI